MKKILVMAAAAVMMVSSTFAMSMSVGLKGIAGGDRTSPEGLSIGGGIDINLNIWKGLGVQVESDVVTLKITNSGDQGITFTDNLLVNIPVMAWYNYDFSHFSIGAGAGVNCILASVHTEPASSNFKIGLAAGVNAKWYMTQNLALVLGVTGNLDCFPTLTKTTSGSSSTYKFVSSDFSRNSIYGSLGVQYKMPFGK